MRSNLVINILCLVFGLIKTTISLADESKILYDVMFIGNPISVLTTQLNCDSFVDKLKDSEYIDVCMDRVLEITYSVTDSIFGADDLEKITFYDVRHGFGFPDYLVNSFSYIHLKKINGKFLAVEKYLVASDPTTNNDIVCARKLDFYPQEINLRSQTYHGKKWGFVNCDYAIKLDDLMKASRMLHGGEN